MQQTQVGAAAVAVLLGVVAALSIGKLPPALPALGAEFEAAFDRAVACIESRELEDLLVFARIGIEEDDRPSLVLKHDHVFHQESLSVAAARHAWLLPQFLRGFQIHRLHRAITQCISNIAIHQGVSELRLQNS